LLLPASAPHERGCQLKDLGPKKSMAVSDNHGELACSTRKGLRTNNSLLSSMSQKGICHDPQRGARLFGFCMHAVEKKIPEKRRESKGKEQAESL
jgi:hypothetical protein